MPTPGQILRENLKEILVFVPAVAYNILWCCFHLKELYHTKKDLSLFRAPNPFLSCLGVFSQPRHTACQRVHFFIHPRLHIHQRRKIHPRYVSRFRLVVQRLRGAQAAVGAVQHGLVFRRRGGRIGKQPVVHPRRGHALAGYEQRKLGKIQLRIRLRRKRIQKIHNVQPPRPRLRAQRAQKRVRTAAERTRHAHGDLAREIAGKAHIAHSRVRAKEESPFAPAGTRFIRQKRLQVVFGLRLNHEQVYRSHMILFEQLFQMARERKAEPISWSTL